uniref:DNA-directed RNA polymerase II third largest subunit n=1 Tax=Amorphochlora amoebiformis TaxID=1561963 RepID=A0A0H5BKG9_9EUKA|nr:DNA-directed RNA polymerase II third largest subunit [Amorphochlora amoebiformis]
MNSKIRIKTIKHNKFFNMVLLENFYLSILNSLKHTMILYLTTIAVESVVIYLNTSDLSDEFIAHRLGFVPMKSNPANDTINKNCKIDMDLFIKSTNKKFPVYNVTSSNIVKKESTIITSNSSLIQADVGSTYKHENYKKSLGIVILKLKKWQGIHLKCLLAQGSPKKHSKWSTISGLMMLEIPRIKWNFAILNIINHNFSIQDLENLNNNIRKNIKKAFIYL